MDPTLTLRPARPDDLAAVDDLFLRSYPKLLKADYPPSVMVLAMPLIARARPSLLASRRYFVVCDDEGRVFGAGGYSLTAPAPDGAAPARQPGLAHVRHFAADPSRLRQGIARAIMRAVLERSKAEGARVIACLSTRTAVPFYAAMGFDTLGPATIPLAPGIDFPAVRMQRSL